MRYLLSLCLLFFSGLSPLAAHSVEGADFFSSLSLQVRVDSQGIEQTGLYFHTSNSTQKKANDLLDVAEVKVEEDEVHFTKKYLHGIGYCISLDLRSSSFLFQQQKHCTSLFQTLVYSSGESLNIVFGVFRI